MKFGLSFAENAIFGNKYFVTNFVVVVDTARILSSGIAICQWLPMISNLCPVGHERYVEEHITSENGRTWQGF